MFLPMVMHSVKLKGFPMVMQMGFRLVIPKDYHLEMLTESLQMVMRWVTPMETPMGFLPMG